MVDHLFSQEEQVSRELGIPDSQFAKDMERSCVPCTNRNNDWTTAISQSPFGTQSVVNGLHENIFKLGVSGAVPELVHDISHIFPDSFALLDP